MLSTDKQTDRQTDKLTNATKNITSFAKEVIIAQECTWWGESIDAKYFVSLLYISVAIKASYLKFSMFSVHKTTISNMFLEFSNFKIDLI